MYTHSSMTCSRLTRDRNAVVILCHCLFKVAIDVPHFTTHSKSAPFAYGMHFQTLFSHVTQLSRSNFPSRSSISFLHVNNYSFIFLLTAHHTLNTLQSYSLCRIALTPAYIFRVALSTPLFTHIFT